ncbi:beta-lactamase family protein [Sinomicrobium kalidii]|uniref:serine hydrolase domain-containing protein n=1 Tax=Sinomicrobium kalidii TaxID=2900738 RepID=UPI001E41AB08|nr:serine hydrolase domain-containing protein [Sinomicrobium kalidii]UGU14538.1 beta-lactamase family protein [Sinomicrobium kalidii]
MRYLIILLIGIMIMPMNLIGQNEDLELFIQSYAEEHQFNGTILVQKDTAVIYYQSFGIADRRFDVPVTDRTVFKVASITKAFTAVLILQLYDEGRLDLEKTIKTYLPRFSYEAGNRVTIHQLLNHTSGMRQIDTISSVDNAYKYGLGFLQKPYTSGQLFHLFEGDSLVNEPGEKWEYNNYEYIVLGKIIEKLYGKPYEEVLNEKILKPLGMFNSGLLKQKKIIKNLASTYFTGTESDVLVNDMPVYIENWYAAGAMYSSAKDLLKFSNALFGLKLISESALDMMLTPELNEYGYGVWIRGREKHRIMERYGRIMGANAVWMQFIDKNVTIIILSNTNLTDLGEFGLAIEKKLKTPDSKK